MDLLATRPWREKFHVSPLFVWELIVRVGFGYARMFPEVETTAHLDALAGVLSLQQPDGGFRSALAPETNAEETGLAMLALHAAHAAVARGAIEARVTQASARARDWLVAARARPRRPAPAFWVGKVLSAPTHIVEAIELAALNPKTATVRRQPSVDARI